MRAAGLSIAMMDTQQIVRMQERGLNHNPLTDFKLLYGTGAMRFNEATNKVEWHRGLKYTIKDGVIYDTAELLADVRELVKASFEEDVPARFVPQQPKAAE